MPSIFYSHCLLNRNAEEIGEMPSMGYDNMMKCSFIIKFPRVMLVRNAEERDYRNAVIEL